MDIRSTTTDSACTVAAYDTQAMQSGLVDSCPSQKTLQHVAELSVKDVSIAGWLRFANDFVCVLFFPVSSNC